MIVCQVTGAAITPKGTELLTSGMVQAVPVRFCFSPEWDSLDRTAVFTADSVSVSCSPTPTFSMVKLWPSDSVKLPL